MYGEGWTYDADADRAVGRAAGEPDGRDRGAGRGRADEARRRCEESANAALSSIELDILRRRDAIRGELPWLKWILFGTWAALIASLSLAGFLLWRSTASEPSRASFPTFSEEGQTYLVLPAGAETVPCRSGSETLVCVVLPKPGGR